MIPGFFPFADEVYCVRCNEPVSTRVAVAVSFVDGKLQGLAHASCEEGE